LHQSNDKNLSLYQYTCPACAYTLYTESDEETLNCQNKDCNHSSPLPIKNYLITTVEEDSTLYIVKDSFMVDHGCCEVRPVLKGTEVEVIKIKKDWFSCVTEDGLSFFIPKNKLERKKK